jgi:hypothetical protein
MAHERAQSPEKQRISEYCRKNPAVSEGIHPWRSLESTAAQKDPKNPRISGLIDRERFWT